MPSHRCRAPGCGRFVSAAGEKCARHTDTSIVRTLDPEISAMRLVLEESLKDIKEPESRAKLIPRIVSVSIQAIRTGRQLGDQANGELLTLLEEAERELNQQHR